MIHLWMTCSELKTDVPLVFYNRKGACSEQVPATPLVNPQSIPFGKLHKIDTAYPEHVVQNKTTRVSLMESKKKLKLKKKTNLPFHLQHSVCDMVSFVSASPSYMPNKGLPHCQDKKYGSIPMKYGFNSGCHSIDIRQHFIS